MNRVVKSSNAKQKSRALLAAAATCYLFAIAGCGIPQLRCALPGSALPQTYQEANNWGNDGVESPEVQTANPSDSATNASSFSDPITLASFGRLASQRERNEPRNFNEGTTYSNDTDNRSEVGPPGMFVSSPEMVDRTPPPVVSSDGPGLEPIPLGTSTDPADMVVGGNSWENSSFVPWFDFFNDQFLVGLIDQALAGNQELRILNEEIEIASNEVLARSGEYLPFVNLGAGADLQKPGLFTRNGAVEDQLEIRPGQPFPDPLPDFLVATNVSWELDIWRKLRNARDAASLRFLGTADGRNYIVTRMVAEIADNYFELLALDNRLETLNQTIAIQEKSLETAKLLKAGGRGTELGVQRFQAEVRKNQSEKLIINQQIVEIENRINFLLGRYPQPVGRMPVDYVNLNLHGLSAGVPAELLQNRSDIRQAERELEAAGLDVRVAKARFYPSLGINAGVGFQAFDPRFIFMTPESLIYNVAGDLVAPLINKRAIKAAYLSANAKQLQSVYNYQRTVLNAYTEVINYMAKVENYRKSIDIKKQQLASLEASVDAATKLFQNARAEYLEVLLAQRDMMEARMVLIETKQQQLSAVVNAYQALGGGSSYNQGFSPLTFHGE